MGAGVGEGGEGGLIDLGVDEFGALADGLADGDAVDFLDAALADLASVEVGDFDLAADDEELAGFEPGTADGGDEVGEAGAGGGHGEGLGGGVGWLAVGAEVDFVEVLGCDAGGYLMDDGDAGEAAGAGLEEVHDVAAGYEETVGVAEGD